PGAIRFGIFSLQGRIGPGTEDDPAGWMSVAAELQLQMRDDSRIKQILILISLEKIRNVLWIVEIFHAVAEPWLSRNREGHPVVAADEGVEQETQIDVMCRLIPVLDQVANQAGILEAGLFAGYNLDVLSDHNSLRGVPGPDRFSAFVRLALLLPG